ncbi:MAG TPA: hypothetical protein VIZ69_10800, partial [Thermoanaerobaculia bacterium]
AVRFHPATFQGTPEPKDEPAGENPPAGAILDYRLAADAAPLTLEIFDGGGRLVRRFSSEEKRRTADLAKIQVAPDWVPEPRPPAGRAGMHRFVWDLHHAVPDVLHDPESRREASGPWAAPGRYTVRLTAAGVRREQPLTVVRDPRVPAADTDLVQQLELALRIQTERVRLAEAIRRGDALAKSAAAARPSARGAAGELDGFLRRVEHVVGKRPVPGEEEPDESEGPPSLRTSAAALQRLQQAVESADAAPTPDALKGFENRRDAASQSMASWEELLRTDLPRVDRALAAAGAKALGAE